MWCDSRKLPFPGKQIAAAFIWKAAGYLTPQGKFASSYRTACSSAIRKAPSRSSILVQNTHR